MNLLTMVKQLKAIVKFQWGMDCCPCCASDNIIECGYKPTNHRIECRDCGKTTYTGNLE